MNKAPSYFKVIAVLPIHLSTKHLYRSAGCDNFIKELAAWVTKAADYLQGVVAAAPSDEWGCKYVTYYSYDYPFIYERLVRELASRKVYVAIHIRNEVEWDEARQRFRR